MELRHRPFLIVISAPSGGGKTTVKNVVLERMPEIAYSVSATTRKPRENEVNGVDYIFVTHEKFREWLSSGELLEWAEIYGEFYGTPKSPILKWLEEGRDVLLDLDVHGKRSVERAFVGRTVSIFLLPPSMEILRERLLDRGTETGEVLEKRLRLARSEMDHAFEYDYWVINDEVEAAAQEVMNIIRAERQRSNRLIYNEFHETKILDFY